MRGIDENFLIRRCDWQQLYRAGKSRAVQVLRQRQRPEFFQIGIHWTLWMAKPQPLSTGVKTID